MAVQSKATLYTYFETGDLPTQQQFADLIDSFQDILVTGDTSSIAISIVGNTLSSSLVATGVTPGSYSAADITVDADGRITTVSNGAAGSNLLYQGNWDASTNTPTLSDGTGTQNYWYIVSVGGSQDLGSGSVTYAEGNWVIHTGTTWVKETNSDVVTSVDGDTGAVVIASADETTPGKIEIATLAELNTGTANNLAITPLTLATSDLSSQVALNVAKDGNATHTGEVTGDGALTAQPSIISNRGAIVPTAGMEVLVNSAGVLYRADVNSFLGGTTNLAVDNVTATTLDITSDTGTNATIPSAGMGAGLMSGADKLTLDSLVSNVNHTGEVTGATVLTIDPTAISNKTLDVALTGTEEVLINDGGLKKTTTQAIADLGGGGGGPLIYAAIVTGTGGGALSVTVIENTLGGTVVWSNVVTGWWHGTLSGVFTPNKTLTLCNQQGSPPTPASVRSANVDPWDVNNIRVINTVNGIGSDTMTRMFIKVEVYT